MYAFGRQISVQIGVGRREMKRGAVFGEGDPGAKGKKGFGENLKRNPQILL